MSSIRRSEVSLTPARRSTTVRLAYVATLILALPLLAQAQSSPFDSGISQIQTMFTGTIAKAGSLIAIVLGGYAYAHGEPGAKKTLAGVAAGSGVAVMAANVLSWLWGA